MSVKKTSVLAMAGIAVGMVFVANATQAQAYVGPGAGFAFVSSFFIIFITFILAFFVLLTWPIRWLFRLFRQIKTSAKSRVRQVVVIGLDGQDPELTEKMIEAGQLPNFARLCDKGTFTRLNTSLLAESPVAWSSFQTGCNPGKHKIFDFLVPNRKAMLPELSSALIGSASRSISLGKIKIPIGKPRIQMRRKNQPFWKVLGDHGVFSQILRVPITFPPEKFNGVLLSAMCVPDLKGSQGTFFYYSADPDDNPSLTSGMQVPMEQNGGTAKSYVSGPANPLRRDGEEMRVSFEVRVGEKNGADAELKLGKDIYPLTKGEYTPWIQIDFKAAPGVKARGLCMFYLLETEPYVKVYMPPIQIDPEKPALPISHPFTYAIYLAKLQGPYATLGVAEDTSALNEGIIDEEAFLKQCWMIHEEREKMLFDALEKSSQGHVTCVFDITDRVQHMFFRCMEDDHPANRGREVKKYRETIRDVYRKMDDLIGRVQAKLKDDTVLMVMSDHGFKPFRRGVNLNTWLYKNGFLVAKNGTITGKDMLHDVDWSKTKAYAVGFGGIYLNLAGREAKGIVQPGEEAERIRREIKEGLIKLHDDQEGVKPIEAVYDTREAYSGPYVKEAPDLIAGFRVGHRVSWSSVTGGLSEEIFEDNTRPWSGDHNMNPPNVPGMLFCNRGIASESPHIMDIGPTILDLFGVPVPKYCDGRSFMPAAGVAQTGSSHKEPEEEVAGLGA